VIGDAILLLGIVVALAGGIQFYAENRYSRKLARWGGFISAIGAAVVLTSTATEASPGSAPLNPTELVVLWGAVAVVMALLIFPHLPRRFRDPIERHIQKDPEDEYGQCDRAAIQCRCEGKGDEVRPEQDSADGRQLAQPQAKSGQPR